MALGAWLSGTMDSGVPGEKDYGAVMWGCSSVLLSNSKRRYDILSRSMSPTFSLTLIHQVLRYRVRRWIKFIGRISYSDAQSTLARLSLEFCITRDSRFVTSSWVTNYKLASSAVIPSSTTSTATQSTFRGPLLTARICEDFAIDGSTFPLSTLSQRLSLPTFSLPY